MESTLAHQTLSFEEMDTNNDGHIDSDEFVNAHHPDHHQEARRIFLEADKNRDGRLDRTEFQKMRRKAYRFAEAMVLPTTKRKLLPKARADVGISMFAVELEDELQPMVYSCCPPPIFIFLMSAIMIGIYVYDSYDEEYDMRKSVLIFHPQKRYEVWRFLTYMFIHAGYKHITNNVVVQLLLGIPLEMIHGWWRVLLVYFLGVIAGSLTTSISDPYTILVGASGGVYALITAHMATVIMNWNEMKLPWLRVILFTVFTIYDVGLALYYRYVEPIDHQIGYAAHFGGALIGLLVGLLFLRNVKTESFEVKLRWAAFSITIALGVIAIGWNIFYPAYFPPPK